MTLPPPTSRRFSRPASALAVVLLGLFWWQALSASRHWSETSDEMPHITAGYAYDRFNDFRMQPENGILPQRVFGLPPLLLGARFPTDEKLWENSSYWQLGWDFFYGLDNPTDRIVFWARALNAFFGVALGVFIFLVARRWYGDGGGLLALGFYTFCPNFLAHSALATSDMAAASGLTLAPWFFWRHLERRDVRSGLLAAGVGGLALVAKFNGILIAPMYALLVWMDAASRGSAGHRWARFSWNFLLCAGQAAGGIAVIWAFYDFRFAIAGRGVPPLVHLIRPWSDMFAFVGWKAPVIQWLLNWKLLPEAWVYGLTQVIASEVVRPSFFAGAYRDHGWWQFFPTLFLVKTPLAMLAGLAVALFAGLRSWFRSAADAHREAFRRWVPVALPALVVWVVAVTSNLNIGHRHILAIYPALFIAVGALALLPRAWLVVPAVLLGGQIAESLSIRPDYPAYFNAFAGGPGRAHRLVVDSSLDWGQSLPALHDWLAANRRPGEKVYLGYFGSAWPPHYGVRPTYFLPAQNLARPPLQPYELEPGLYCISATTLSEVYSPYRGPWRAAWEARFRSPPADYHEFDALRFSRLCKYLQHRKPDAEAGYSILIFRLDARDLQDALTGPVTGW